MRTISPAFQFYPADWLADLNVMMMTCEQRGAYIQLLAICWREGYIPNDDNELLRLTGIIGFDAETKELNPKGGLRVVKGCFNQSPTNPLRLVHGRLEAERKKQEEWREKSARGGKHSVETRQTKALSSKDGSDLVPTKTKPKGNTSSSSSSSSSDVLRADCVTAAQGYCHTFRVVGQKNYELIADAIYIEAQKTGVAPQDIADAMIAARHEYESMPDKGFEYQPVPFVTSGTWVRKGTWKKGPAKSAPVTQIPQGETLLERTRRMREGK